MKKFAITVGEIGGKLVVLDGPGADVDAQVEALRKLTRAGGKSSKGDVTDAVILHSVKGVIKKRHNIPGAAESEAKNAPKAKAKG